MNRTSLALAAGALLGTAACQTAGNGGGAPDASASSGGSLLDRCGTFALGEGARTGIYKGGLREGVTMVQDHEMAVLSVDANGTAKVLLAFGAYKPWGVTRPTCSRETGKFFGTTLVVKHGRLTLRYTFVEGLDTVQLSSSSSTGTSRGEVARVG